MPATPLPEVQLIAAQWATRMGAVLGRHRPPFDPLLASEFCLWHAIVRDVIEVLVEEDNGLDAERLTAASGWRDQQGVREIRAVVRNGGRHLDCTPARSATCG